MAKSRRRVLAKMHAGSDMGYLWRRFQSTCCTVASAVKSFSIGKDVPLQLLSAMQ